MPFEGDELSITSNAPARSGREVLDARRDGRHPRTRAKGANLVTIDPTRVQRGVRRGLARRVGGARGAWRRQRYEGGSFPLGSELKARPQIKVGRLARPSSGYLAITESTQLGSGCIVCADDGINERPVQIPRALKRIDASQAEQIGLVCLAPRPCGPAQARLQEWQTNRARDCARLARCQVANVIVPVPNGSSVPGVCRHAGAEGACVEAVLRLLQLKYHLCTLHCPELFKRLQPCACLTPEMCCVEVQQPRWKHRRQAFQVDLSMMIRRSWRGRSMGSGAETEHAREREARARERRGGLSARRCKVWSLWTTGRGSERNPATGRRPAAPWHVDDRAT